MKLQKQLSRRVESKNYPKYVVTIPPKIVEKLGWKEGIELKADIKDGQIVLHPTNDSERYSKE